MWLYRRILKILGVERKINEETLRLVKSERELFERVQNKNLCIYICAVGGRQRSEYEE